MAKLQVSSFTSDTPRLQELALLTAQATVVIDWSNYLVALLCFIVRSWATVDTLRYRPSYYRQLQSSHPKTVRMLHSSLNPSCMYRLYYLRNSFLNGKQGVIIFFLP